MSRVTLEQVFNRTEELNYTNQYNYIEQRGLTGKASLVSSNESLRKIPLKIKLHHSWCNPQDVIAEVEEKAPAREIINYFQHGKYVGNFVIKSYSVKIEQKIVAAISCAILSVELLECINSSSSNNVFHMVQNVVVPTISTAGVYSAVSMAVSNSNTNTMVKNLQKKILEEIKNQGITSATNVTKTYTNNLNFGNNVTPQQAQHIKSEIAKLPKTIINTALRSI